MAETPTTGDYRIALSLALDLGTGAPWDAIRDRVRELHTAANGSQLPERPCHVVTRVGRPHPVHVYRFQRAESYWCPGLAETDETVVPATQGSGTVAYRNPWPSDVLLCREHGKGWSTMVALTADDLPDGGVCTECGRDVLTIT